MFVLLLLQLSFCQSFAILVLIFGTIRFGCGSRNSQVTLARKINANVTFAIKCCQSMSTPLEFCVLRSASCDHPASCVVSPSYFLAVKPSHTSLLHSKNPHLAAFGLWSFYLLRSCSTQVGLGQARSHQRRPEQDRSGQTSCFCLPVARQVFDKSRKSHLLTDLCALPFCQSFIF